MKNSNRVTRHHIIPKSCGGKNNRSNISKLRQIDHRALHQVFSNDSPHEQILRILENSKSVLTLEFKEKITDIIYNSEITEVYNEHCLNVKKMVRHILDK